MTLGACNCTACQKFASMPPSSAYVPSSPFTSIVSPTVPFAPCTTHSTYKADYCNNCLSEAFGRFLAISAVRTPQVVLAEMDFHERYTLSRAIQLAVRNITRLSPDADDAVQIVLVEAIYTGWDRMTEILPGDLKCEECGVYVSNTLSSDKRHWDSICGDCYNHTNGELHTECPECDSCNTSGSCSCCSACGQHYCICCDYCGSPTDECECEECDDCGASNASYCGCGNQPYRFGSTRTPQWEDSSDLSDYAPYEEPLPTMGDLDKNVDPVQAAANFYLLSGIADTVRFAEVSGDDDGIRRMMDAKADIIHNDDALAALVLSAKKTQQRLVERLDRNFLAYALSAVGGELRYHRALSSNTLSSHRSSAWDQFVEIVQERGAQVLFDADVLFREFESSGYGGVPWGNAAKITGKRLRGDIPSWLFVDRMFALEHNGGCFLNKVQWSENNGLGYGLTHMKRVLNAHAGKCGSAPEGCMCEVCVKGETDWDLLLRVASPEVAEMFRKVDSRINRLVRRFGATLTAIKPTKAKSQKRPGGGACPDCGYYGCICAY